MKKVISLIIIALIMAVSVLSAAVSADLGPNDSVNISFRNTGTELCYCTLLSEKTNSGPFSAKDESRDKDVVDRAFSDYRDPDGFYYLHNYSRIDVSKEFEWNYFPPSTFKILLYYPGTETFAVSGIYEQYAIKSFFTVDLKDIQVGADNLTLTAERKYSPFFVVFAFIMRMLITLAIEVVIAIPFGFKRKKQLASIIIINFITQLVLNLILYIEAVDSGIWFIFLYISLELLIFIIEAIIYAFALRDPKNPRADAGDCVLYSFLGNSASLICGALITIVFPWVVM